MNFAFKILTVTLLGALCVYAAQGPRHKSLRAYAMGNAHVAVVDDKEAIYYNYAGLNQLGKLGDYKNHPEMGYYPGNMIDMRINAGGAGAFDQFHGAYDLASDLQDLYDGARDDAKAKNAADPTAKVTTERAYMDSLAAHPELTKRINKYDHLLFSMIAKAGAELASHDFGGSIWVNGDVAPYVDGGIILPFVGVDTFYVDAVIQAGGAVGITEDLAVGVGVKAAKRQSVDYVRFDAALNDVFFNKLDGQRITPDLTAGIDYSPRFCNRNTAYSRKMNIAMDFEDALNHERGYKPLSHLDFGIELEQVLLAIPGYNDNWRFLKLRLSGGFKGGYPSAGIAVEALRLITVEAATWGEERGYYTGQDENRLYMLQVSLGF